jgi:hypothetical protein
MLKDRIEARIEAYEEMVIGLSNENKFKAEYQAKIEELKKVLSMIEEEASYNA